MDRINFMDLSRQYEKISQEISNAINGVFSNSSYINGPEVERFEKEFADYIQSRFVSGVSNGTDALFLACKALDIGPGDEVIVPSSTFIASAWGPIHAGADVVFVDCLEDTWQIDPASIAENITDRTKAVMGVHLYGMPFDIKGVEKAIKGQNVHLIEDCAQAHGATYEGRPVGTFGKISGFSFYPGKNLGAYGDAGAVATNDEKIDSYIKIIRNQGSEVRYKHDHVGYNMRLDGLQAAVLSVKLKYLPDWTKKRQKIAEKYARGIVNGRLVKQSSTKRADSVYHLYVVCADNRDDFIKHMKNNNIFCGMHYPIPCHLQKAVVGKNSNIELPNSEYLAEHCVSLPMFPEMTEEEVDKVIEACNAF